MDILVCFGRNFTSVKYFVSKLFLAYLLNLLSLFLSAELSHKFTHGLNLF